MRARSGKTVIRKRKRLAQKVKGYRASRRNLWRQSKVTHIRAGVFAYRDRRQRKRVFRALWITRISAACRPRGIRYNELITGLQRAAVALDRKMLSELAIHDPAAFDQIVAVAREHLPRPAAKAAKSA
jgi:large subunit ribosomal protein L20